MRLCYITFTAIDIRFVSPKGQDFIRQERVTKPGDPYSTIFSKWNTGHSPVSNFSIWNTEDGPVFDKLQYMEHRIWKKENMVLNVHRNHTAY